MKSKSNLSEEDIKLQKILDDVNYKHYENIEDLKSADESEYENSKLVTYGTSTKQRAIHKSEFDLEFSLNIIKIYESRHKLLQKYVSELNK